jgi:hypothetical protein
VGERKKLWIGWVGIGLLLGGCVRQTYLFQTPYDRALSRALRRSDRGWVTHGEDTTKATGTHLVPGQFVRLIIEGPFFQEESKVEWSVIRVDTFRIQSDSLAYLPWAGSFRVGGLSLDSAHVRLEELARKVYREPRVRLYPLYPVYLFGAVPQPGILLFDTPHIKLVDLMPHMGTSARVANYREVKILRGPLTSPHVILLDLRRCSAFSDTLAIKPFDIVYVPPNKIVVISENVQIFTIAFTILQAINIVLIFRANLMR